MLIAHATDLTGDDEAAFVHAAALASASGARLVSLHAGVVEGSSATAAQLASQWGRAIAHEFRRIDRDDDAAGAVVEAVRELRPSLLVLGTHARHGLAAVLRGSVGEAIARNLAIPTLLVPNTASGFIDTVTGAARLSQILIPAGTAAEATQATEAVHALIALLGCAMPRLQTVHFGPVDRELAALGAQQLEGWSADAIVDLADRREVELIAMTTRGHDGLADVLGGSRTEHVIRYARRPVLVVPWRA